MFTQPDEKCVSKPRQVCATPGSPYVKGIRADEFMVFTLQRNVAKKPVR